MFNADVVHDAYKRKVHGKILLNDKNLSKIIKMQH